MIAEIGRHCRRRKGVKDLGDWPLGAAPAPRRRCMLGTLLLLLLLLLLALMALVLLLLLLLLLLLFMVMVVVWWLLLKLMMRSLLLLRIPQRIMLLLTISAAPVTCEHPRMAQGPLEHIFTTVLVVIRGIARATRRWPHIRRGASGPPLDWG
jgi:hypothetical protein